MVEAEAVVVAAAAVAEVGKMIRKYCFIIFLCLFGVMAGVAEARSLYWDKIGVEIFVERDGSFKVIEELHYIFDGAWNGGIRNINTDKLNEIEFLELWEGDKQYQRGDIENVGAYETYNSGSDFVIKWRSRLPGDPPYAATPKTFKLVYVVKGGLNYSSDYDELYWQAIFSDRDGVVKRGEVTVHLPEPLADNSLAFLYSQADNAHWYKIDNQSFRFTADNISAGALFEVKVDFPKGIVAKVGRSFGKQKFSFLWAFMLPLLVFAGMWRIYLRYGRDQDYPEPAQLPTAPPDDLPPAMAGLIVDEQVDSKEITATIVDLARRGYINIVEFPGTFFGWGKKYEFTLIKEPSNLLAFEMKVIKGLFGQPRVGDQTDTTEMSGKFYKHVSGINKAITDRAMELGFFEAEPLSVILKYVFIGLPVTILGFVLMFFAGWDFALFMIVWYGLFSGVPAFVMIKSAREGNWLMALFMSVFVIIGTSVVFGGFLFPSLFVGLPFFSLFCYNIFISGLVIMCFAPAMPRKTLIGTKEKVLWQAFKKYLNDKKATGGDLEALLPYAIALGVTGNFLERFAGQGMAAVGWYSSTVGGGVGSFGQAFSGGSSGGAGAGRSFDAAGFSSSMNSMVSSVSGSMGSPSSGGGGGGGGGGGIYYCASNWTCTEWSECSENGIEIRTCTDLKKCKTAKSPEQVRTCKKNISESPVESEDENNQSSLSINSDGDSSSLGKKNDIEELSLSDNKNKSEDASNSSKNKFNLITGAITALSSRNRIYGIIMLSAVIIGLMGLRYFSIPRNSAQHYAKASSLHKKAEKLYRKGKTVKAELYYRKAQIHREKAGDMTR